MRSLWPMLPLLLLLVSGCGKDRPADGAMEGMPGMSAPTGGQTDSTLVFTAAQVQHGGVHWEEVHPVSTAQSVSVPGTVVPDEDRTARLGAPARARVLAVRVRPGDRVGEGALLV